MQSLAQMRAAAKEAEAVFEATVSRNFPGLNKWHWSRAVDAAKGGIARKNDDTSQDAALASDTEIRAAHDSFIEKLHAFYKARDGENGVLGSRGL